MSAERKSLCFLNVETCQAGTVHSYVDRVKRIWYLSPKQAAKVQASLRIRALSPEPSLLADTSSESRGTFRQKTRSVAPLNGWACAVKICHDGMLEDTNSLDGAHVGIMIDVRRTVVNVRLLTGTYYLQADRAMFHGNGTTNLCLLCSAAPEDRLHYITACAKLGHARQPYLVELEKKKTLPVTCLHLFLIRALSYSC